MQALGTYRRFTRPLHVTICGPQTYCRLARSVLTGGAMNYYTLLEMYGNNGQIGKRGENATQLMTGWEGVIMLCLGVQNTFATPLILTSCPSIRAQSILLCLSCTPTCLNYNNMEICTRQQEHLMEELKTTPYSGFDHSTAIFDFVIVLGVFVVHQGS